jgi:hypothetical protein
MFFLRREEPLGLAEDRLMGLRLSLNAPVVSTADLPVGPARAAIAVHEEPDGRPNVTVAVRSIKSGELVLYSYDGDLREESSVAVGADAALSFAEGMGFLFDEDELAAADSQARARAFGLCRDLMGIESVTSPPSRSGRIAEDDVAFDFGPALDLGAAFELDEPLEEAEFPLDPDERCELELTDPVDLDEPLSVSPAPASAASVPSEPPRLTKFRHPAPSLREPSRVGAPASDAVRPREGADARAGAAATGTAAGRRRAALGKLRLIKRKRGSGDGQSWILKLLSSF